MPNNLGGIVTKMTARLDRVLAQEAKTSFLQINDAFLGEFVGSERSTTMVHSLTGELTTGGCPPVVVCPHRRPALPCYHGEDRQ